MSEDKALPALVETTGVEVVDPRSGSWLFRVEALPADAGEHAGSETSLATLRAAAGLVQYLPALQGVASNRAIRVVFSKETAKLLRKGTAELVKTSKDTLPVARDVATKQFVEIGKVTGGAAVVAGGAATAGTLAAAAPILIVAAVAAAAAFAEQRAMERKFSELQKAVERLEIRLRDDDLGALEAADLLVDHLQIDLAGGNVAPQLGMELAVARREVERVYLSRRRFASRFIQALEKAQNEKDDKKPDRPKSGWAGEIADELRDRKSGVVDELALFVQAMVVRARLTAATAAIVAWQGDGNSALRLIDDLDEELKQDYYQLYRKVRALARFGPEKSWWKGLPGLANVPLLAGRDADIGKERMAGLVDRMESLLGSSIEAHERDVEVVIPAGAVEALLLPAQPLT